MSTALVSAASLPAAPHGIPAVPWRDPHTVSPEALARYITNLEAACRENPHEAGLQTCLGMAYAMNYDVYRSMDALEAAIQIEPEHFFARLKYAELHYRLRALIRAEEETGKALDLASNSWEYSIARRQLQEIRRLMREGTQKPEWSKPLHAPALWLVALALVLCLAVYWK